MRLAMKYGFGRGVPTLIPSKIISTARIRQIQRALYNVKITLLCGFVTFLVLRGTIGAGSFGTPVQDLTEIREFLPRHKEPARVLREVKQLTMIKKQEMVEDDEERPAGRHSYSLGPKISDWNKQREHWLQRNPHSRPSSSSGRPKILLITGSQPKACGNPAGDHHLLKAIKNKLDYCTLHGMEIFYSMADLDEEMAGFWAKLPLLRRLMLSHPETEWIWWMDSDAIITDMSFELPMDRYKDHNLVIHGRDDDVYKKLKWIGLNTGSFLLRNCQWSLDLLDAWARMGAIRKAAGKLATRSLTGRPEFEADDQPALVYLLATERSTWGEKVYMESEYYLHGDWTLLVEKYEEVMEKHHPGYGDERWPFVTHFVGCKPCETSGDFPAEQCLKHMERAFNFADNQVLKAYGFRHLSLATSIVEPIYTAHPRLHRLDSTSKAS